MLVPLDSLQIAFLHSVFILGEMHFVFFFDHFVYFFDRYIILVQSTRISCKS